MPAKKSTAKKPPVAPKKKTPQEFMTAYQALCEKYGFQLNVVPTFVARDDGTWSVKMQVSVSEFKVPE